MEAAAAAGSSNSNAPSCRRRAKKRRMPPPALLRVGRCHRAIVAPSSRSPLPVGAKRARAATLVCSPDCNNSSWRECASLGDDMAGLIAEHLLAHDVADYLCFRAVCRSWRRCSVDPRAHGWLDPRFHPHRWRIFQEKHATPDRLRFLNNRTGKCIQVDLPELRDHKVLGQSSEGLLVLLHGYNRVRLLNPLTRQLTRLPPLTTLLPYEIYNQLSEWHLDTYFDPWGSAISIDGSAFVLCFYSARIVGVVKPGDKRWTLKSGGMQNVSSMFAGPF